MPDAFNYGNRLIEHCLRPLLRLESAEFPINAYQPLSQEQIEEVNACDYVVWPGCTLIQRKEHPGMEQLQYATPPIFCFGAAFFTRLPFPNPQYCRRLERPVGARDSFTHGRLRWYGIESAFIGCPTMFAGSATEWKRPGEGPVVFCFGRKDMDLQLKVFDQIRQERPTVVVIQEEKQRRYCPPGTNVLEYDDVDKVIAAYATASVVVTGRLHAALPAIVSGTPVVFSQRVHDSRIRLLKDIGLQIHHPRSPDILPLVRGLLSGQATMPSDIFGKVFALKERYLAFITDFRQRVSALRSPSTGRGAA
ncbi:MAG: polysaccharide pyruvyl transferase family protein [Gemmatimonadales bacterium]